jgi:hypothetical protein
MLDFEPLQVRVEPDFGSAHRVTSSNGILIAFAADLTFAHICYTIKVLEEFSIKC